MKFGQPRFPRWNTHIGEMNVVALMDCGTAHAASTSVFRFHSACSSPYKSSMDSVRGESASCRFVSVVPLQQPLLTFPVWLLAGQFADTIPTEHDVRRIDSSPDKAPLRRTLRVLVGDAEVPVAARLEHKPKGHEADDTEEAEPRAAVRTASVEVHGACRP
eukprot:CAMPEP_0195578588 /NCGR_PEP_ID=MMETSP0814-20130614/12323_1 /TAXON_ID=97485 /ORGANISM="Prymnesium parvum, Strain Texoma1" /LENGTH=160 /DNA_ID=CAMNT_0040715139 /DNA_START=213 /DNA_END=691 /DNA_ORIENTATION=+